MELVFHGVGIRRHTRRRHHLACYCHYILILTGVFLYASSVSNKHLTRLVV